LLHGLFSDVVICVELQPHIRGWLLASVNGHKTGIVPANYVRVLGKRKGTRHSERNQAEPSDLLPSASNRMQNDIQRQQSSTISHDVWSFDDVNS